MKTINLIAMSALAFSFTFLPLVACEEGQPLSEVKPLERATQFIGMSIRDAQGGISGTVKDLVLNDDRTRVDHLIVAFAGVEKPEEVPFSGLHISSDGAILICPIAPEGTMGLEGLTAAKVAEPPVVTYEGRLVSKLLGLAVRDSDNRRIGTIRDFLISGENGEVTEATVALPGFMNIGRKLASVEWSAIRLPMAVQYARVDRTVKDVRALAYEESEYWQHLGFGGMPTERTVRGVEEREREVEPMEDPFRLYR